MNKMAVKEKSFSLSRLFHKSTTKLGSHGKSSNATATSTCEIHKNEKANDQEKDDVLEQRIEQNNNDENNSHKKITKTKSDADLTRLKVHNHQHHHHNHESSSGHRLSLKRLKFSHKKSSCSSCSTLKSSPSSSQSSSFKEDSPSKRQSVSVSGIEIEDRDQKALHSYAILFESIQYKDTSLLNNVFMNYPNLDINLFNEDGIAAIHFAAMVGSTPCIDSMVEYGADIDLQDVRGNPPLHYAISMKKYEFAGMLMKLGAKTCHLSRQLYPELKKKSRRTWHFF